MIKLELKQVLFRPSFWLFVFIQQLWMIINTGIEFSMGRELSDVVSTIGILCDMSIISIGVGLLTFIYYDDFRYKLIVARMGYGISAKQYVFVKFIVFLLLAAVTLSLNLAWIIIACFVIFNQGVMFLSPIFIYLLLSLLVLSVMSQFALVFGYASNFLGLTNIVFLLSTWGLVDTLINYVFSVLLIDSSLFSLFSYYYAYNNTFYLGSVSVWFLLMSVFYWMVSFVLGFVLIERKDYEL